jgi:hypothetical protein
MEAGFVPSLRRQTGSGTHLFFGRFPSAEALGLDMPSLPGRDDNFKNNGTPARMSRKCLGADILDSVLIHHA